MMELGATICLPRAPRCEVCPVRKFCRARALGLADSLPAARVKRAPENVTLAAAALLDARGRTLLVRPRATEAALFSRMWQFPAANVSADALSATRRSAGAKEISALRAELAKHLRVSLGIVGIKAALLERADVSRHSSRALRVCRDWRTRARRSSATSRVWRYRAPRKKSRPRPCAPFPPRHRRKRKTSSRRATTP
jgi:adenine-specific DNA glycosylase